LTAVTCSFFKLVPDLSKGDSQCPVSVYSTLYFSLNQNCRVAEDLSTFWAGPKVTESIKWWMPRSEGISWLRAGYFGMPSGSKQRNRPLFFLQVSFFRYSRWGSASRWINFRHSLDASSSLTIQTFGNLNTLTRVCQKGGACLENSKPICSNAENLLKSPSIEFMEIYPWDYLDHPRYPIEWNFPQRSEWIPTHQIPRQGVWAAGL